MERFWWIYCESNHKWGGGGGWWYRLWHDTLYPQEHSNTPPPPSAPTNLSYENRIFVQLVHQRMAQMCILNNVFTIWNCKFNFAVYRIHCCHNDIKKIFHTNASWWVCLGMAGEKEVRWGGAPKHPQDTHARNTHNTHTQHHTHNTTPTTHPYTRTPN